MNGVRGTYMRGAKCGLSTHDSGRHHAMRNYAMKKLRMEGLVRTDVLRIPSMHDIGHEALHEMMHDWALLPGYMILHA